MDYIHIKNLEKYHPGYKDRTLIWCKTYFTMLNADPEFEMLCEIDKWRYVALIMLELQVKGPIPADKEYLQRKGFDFRRRSMSLSLQMLQNLIEVRNAPVTENPENVTQSRVEESKIEKSIGGFAPPTTEEVLLQIQTKGYQNITAKRFIEFYACKGWMVGRNKMTDWKIALSRADSWQPLPKQEEEGPVYEEFRA